jgi:transcriptional regulator GlxA family with amidase domain
LQDMRDWEQRLAAVDLFLAEELSKSKRRIPAELSWAWAALGHSHGLISIRSLAVAIGWSERHLTNQFRAYLGVLPKAAGRRLRFSHAFRLLSQTTEELSAIAAHAGFSDQSHMTREFQAFTGSSPHALRLARFETLPGIPATVLQSY